MKTKLILGLAVVVVLTPSFRADDAGKELEKFAGEWVAEAVEREGRQLSEGEVKKVRLTVKGEKYTFRMGDQVIEGTHKLDPSKTPKQIDAVRTKGPDAGKTLRGIYELDDTTYRVCFAAPDKDRPTKFSSKEGGGVRVLTFKRAKP